MGKGIIMNGVLFDLKKKKVLIFVNVGLFHLIFIQMIKGKFECIFLISMHHFKYILAPVLIY